MTANKNLFGGGNAISTYVPITEIEQEFISRLIESDDLQILVHDWGIVNKPRAVFGDKNLHLHFPMSFNRPDAPMPVWFFDLELKTRAGLSLFRQKLPCDYNGQPLHICSGVVLDMVWDISINAIDPKVIKTLMPNVIGMTTRRMDKDTWDLTVEGNMKLSNVQKQKIYELNDRENKVKSERWSWRKNNKANS
jgi:hypothetical protein